MDTATVLTLLTVLLTGLALGVALGVLWSRSRAASTEAPVRAEAAVVRDGLERLQHQLGELARDRATWQGRLAQQVEDVRHGTDQLRRETRSLSTALRKPQVRGRWGEMHLRRAVELAGLVDRCDFEEQVRLADGSLRPDLVVRLAGGRSVVVDAKVPLDAFLDAAEVDDDLAGGDVGEDAAREERDHHLRRHAAQLRSHVDALAARRYWRELDCSPEFVVLFVPGESFLAAALDVDPRLLDDAATQRVVLASPTTLIALLRTVALGWSQEALADRAADIHRLGRDLHDRLGVMSGHLDSLGRSLTAAVGHFNGAVGSYESRVLVAARRFNEMALTEEELAAVRQVEQATRAVAPPASRAHSA